MASIQNIVIDNQGVNWKIDFEYTDDGQTLPWQTFTANFPSDFNEINSDELESTMLGLAMAVARNAGIDV